MQNTPHRVARSDETRYSKGLSSVSLFPSTSHSVLGRLTETETSGSWTFSEMKLKKTVFVIITNVQKSIQPAFVINQQLSFSNCVRTNKNNTGRRKVESFMKAS